MKDGVIRRIRALVLCFATICLLGPVTGCGEGSDGSNGTSGIGSTADTAPEITVEEPEPGVVGREVAYSCKVFHLMSYHSPWEWTDDMFRGFRDQLDGMDIEYRILEMDAKRNSSEAWLTEVAGTASGIIDTWHPDLVYATDDNAQKHVTSRFAGSEIPFVFSGVNAPPDLYGFTGNDNVTGVLEREHIAETVRLLRELAPDVTKIAVIVDDDPTWLGVTERVERELSNPSLGVELIGTEVLKTFADYKRVVIAYQESADALGLLGIHTFRDETGTNVPWQEVLKWTAGHSSLPDFSFWKDRISYGTLCAVYVSGYQQGRAAGIMARKILEEGSSPSEIAIRPTVKGQPIMSLARARDLGLSLMSDILLSSKVVQRYAWDKVTN